MTKVDEPTAATELERFHVFGGPDRQGNPKELGLVEAPTTGLATVYASQVFGRRGEGSSLRVVCRGVSTTAPAYERPFAHHALRRVDGYSIRERLAQARKGEMHHV
jgi:1,2-phenylacetyl-CoA epoxidase PaaB subunit